MVFFVWASTLTSLDMSDATLTEPIEFLQWVVKQTLEASDAAQSNGYFSQAKQLPMHSAIPKWNKLYDDYTRLQQQNKLDFSNKNQYADPDRICASKKAQKHSKKKPFVSIKLRVLMFFLNTRAQVGEIILEIGELEDETCGYGGIKSMQVLPSRANAFFAEMANLFEWKTYESLHFDKPCMGLRKKSAKKPNESWCVLS
jgi:hypothetical protein